VKEEQEFLFRSLDDLDAERDAGGIDEETYARLHADYTARAAAAVRAERSGRDVDPEAPATSARRRVAVVGGLVVFAAVAAVVLAFALGARLPGQTITGDPRGGPAVTTKQRERALEAVVKANPSDAHAHLALARFRLGNQDAAGALTEYQTAAALDPTNAEPFAYSGWIIRLQGYPDQGLALLDKAIGVDGSYPDARFFRGFVLLRDKDRPAAAIPDFQQYLVLQPDSPLAGQVRSLLAQAVAATSPSSSSTTRP
jgi:cytochrome c-type biogenesis protein CcmH/NrfG